MQMFTLFSVSHKSVPSACNALRDRLRTDPGALLIPTTTTVPTAPPTVPTTTTPTTTTPTTTATDSDSDFLDIDLDLDEADFIAYDAAHPSTSTTTPTTADPIGDALYSKYRCAQEEALQAYVVRAEVFKYNHHPENVDVQMWLHDMQTGLLGLAPCHRAALMQLMSATFAGTIATEMDADDDADLE